MQKSLLFIGTSTWWNIEILNMHKQYFQINFQLNKKKEKKKDQIFLVRFAMLPNMVAQVIITSLTRYWCIDR